MFLDTITYGTLLVGVIRAGHVVFPISPRNSPQAVAHLLQKTGAAHVFIGVEPALQELADSAMKIVSVAGSVTTPTTSPMPTFEDLYVGDGADFKPLAHYRPGWDDDALIMHSSGASHYPVRVQRLIVSLGSTAFPKPIVWSHYRLLLLSLIPCATLFV